MRTWNISEYQKDIKEWNYRNFGDEVACPPIIAAMGLAEEAGEVCRALLKDYQQIRGTHEEWMDKLKEELGDVFVKIIDVGARAGFDMDKVIADRWSEVRKRDWVADKIGHGI